MQNVYRISGIKPQRVKAVKGFSGCAASSKVKHSYVNDMKLNTRLSKECIRLRVLDANSQILASQTFAGPCDNDSDE